MTNDQILSRIKHDVQSKFRGVKINKRNHLKMVKKVSNYCNMRLMVYGKAWTALAFVTYKDKALDVDIRFE